MCVLRPGRPNPADGPAGTGVGDGALLALRWDQVDRLPVLLWIAAAGVAGAVLLGVAGLPAVDLHGPLHRIWGVMDPLCGGTRAVYWMARGRLDLAWEYNPGTFGVGLSVVAVYARAFYGRLSGRWLTVRVRRELLLTVAAVSLIALEVNQQINAALLMRP